MGFFFPHWIPFKELCHTFTARNYFFSNGRKWNLWWTIFKVTEDISRFPDSFKEYTRKKTKKHWGKPITYSPLDYFPLKMSVSLSNPCFRKANIVRCASYDLAVVSTFHDFTNFIWTSFPRFGYFAVIFLLLQITNLIHFQVAFSQFYSYNTISLHISSEPWTWGNGEDIINTDGNVLKKTMDMSKDGLW